MSKKIYFTLIVFCIMSSSSLAQSWNLVWADEFNGPSIDMNSWTHEIGTGSNGWGNNELQFYTARPQNSQIINGQLAIICKKESYAGRQYTSARMITQGKQSWKYGKIEARIKIPKQQGLWPAFWTLGNSFSSVGWPKCGEIDIMEHINTNEKIHGTIHWDANGYATYGGDTTLNDVNQYHDYSIEWDQFGIRWFVDGVQYHSANTANNINSTDEFHEEFFLILNMAIGGNWPGSPASNFVSDTLFIDYVRVYEWGFPNSTESLEKEIEASLFPNPLLQGQSLNIHLKNSRKHSITIYNTLGVPMYHKHNLSKQHSISSSQLVAGVYYAIIQDEQQNFIRKKLLIQ